MNGHYGVQAHGQRAINIKRYPVIIQAELKYHYVLKNVKQFWTFLTIYGISGPKMEALFQFSVLLFNIIRQ